MNQRESERYLEICRDNLNKPMSQLRCPRCEAQAAYRDYEMSDHPGVFACKECEHSFMA